MAQVKNQQRMLQQFLDGVVDKRTGVGIAMESILSALREAPQDAARAILHRSIATTTMIETALAQEVLNRKGELLTAEGELSAGVKELMRVQRSNMELLKALPVVDNSRRMPKKKEIGLADIILQQGGD